MDCGKLIDLVRERDELYDYSHSRYGDNLHKDRIWKEIAGHLKQSVTDCKKAWVNLRDSYRRSIKRRREAKSGQSAKKMRKWKFEDEMSFLQAHFQERNVVSNPDIDDNHDPGDESDYSEINLEAETDTEVESASTETGDKNPDKTKISKYNKYSTKNKSRRQVPRECEESSSAVLMNYSYMLDNKSETPCMTSEMNAVDAFLAGISFTLKTFSPYHLNIAKQKIFSVVSELEMQQIVSSGAATSYAESPIIPIKLSELP